MKQTLCLIFSKIKIEFFLKGSLDLIPSPLPSVKTQILGRELCLRCKGKTLKYKKFVDITQQCFAYTPQANFPANDLNFSLKVKVMGSNPGYLLKKILLYEFNGSDQIGSE